MRVDEEKIMKIHLNMFLDSRAIHYYKGASSLAELKNWVNNTQRTSLPKKLKGAVNNNEDKHQKKFIQYLKDQVKARKKKKQDAERQDE